MSVNVYGIPIKYKDKLDLLKKVLRIYASVININTKKNYLRPRLVDVLAFYILFGYNGKLFLNLLFYLQSILFLL